MSEITFAAIAARISTLVRVPSAELTPQTALRDLVRESFALVELVVDLQEEFAVFFTQEDLREVVTLGDLTALLRSSLAVSREAGS